GDREFGFILSRMRLDRKVVTGHWQDPDTQARIDAWTRAAAGWHDWQGARFVRFGDNMRQVAVTEGDKVEPEMKLGYSVNTHGAGDLVAAINDTPAAAVDTLIKESEDKYALAGPLRKAESQLHSLRDAANIELGLKTFLEQG